MLRTIREGTVGSIVIDRPDKRNAFSDAMWADLVEAVAEMDHDDRVRVVVFRGADPAVFSAGADLDDLREAASDQERARAGMDAIRRAFTSVAEASKPTIAAVRGACHGGAVGLVVCCDLRVIDATARFSVPSARLGLVYPFPALRRLVALLGPGQARRLLYTSAEFDAGEAVSMGFAEILASPDEFEASVAGLADEIAARSATSVRLTKQVLGALDQAPSHLDDLARELETAALAGPDHAEGLDALMSRRPPRFS